MLQKNRNHLWTIWFFMEELIDLQLYYSRTLLQEDFKRECFKHFKECKYYYGRTLANQNVKQKWQAEIKFKRRMPKLDVFLQLTYCHTEVSRSSHRRCLVSTPFLQETSRRLLLSSLKKIFTNLRISDKQKHQKDSHTEKKRKAWSREKQTRMPVTLIEDLAVTDKG